MKGEKNGVKKAGGIKMRMRMRKVRGERGKGIREVLRAKKEEEREEKREEKEGKRKKKICKCVDGDGGGKLLFMTIKSKTKPVLQT